MAQSGVIYHGLDVIGGGSILAGLILGAIATCVIGKNFLKGATFSLAGAILTIFGLMHGTTIGIGRTPAVAAAYCGVVIVLYACAQFASVTKLEPEHEAEDEEEMPVVQLGSAETFS